MTPLNTINQIHLVWNSPRHVYRIPEVLPGLLSMHTSWITVHNTVLFANGGSIAQKWLPRAIMDQCRGALLWWDSPLLPDWMMDMYNFLKFAYRTCSSILLTGPWDNHKPLLQFHGNTSQLTGWIQGCVVSSSWKPSSDPSCYLVSNVLISTWGAQLNHIMLAF